MDHELEEVAYFSVIGTEMEVKMVDGSAEHSTFFYHFDEEIGRSRFEGKLGFVVIFSQVGFDLHVFGFFFVFWSGWIHGIIV